MSDVAIKFENISKQYRLGKIGTGTISHDLNRWWARVRGKEDPFLKVTEMNDRAAKAGSGYVWALKDINLEVKQGEVLGIIGKNGAGKSTLLKILSRVTTPTTGEIKAYGRIASLLEVGTGFHTEMTGRENIFMNGSIMGMSKVEIRKKFDEIVDFAGVEKYIDTPVKRYSSGMIVRLGFAVAAHLEPEILVVDEVLAVGDAEFQKRALGKMQDVSKKSGRTVLVVSHNMTIISTLAKNAVFLQNGNIILRGDPSFVINKYLADQNENGYIYFNRKLNKCVPTIQKISVLTSLPNNTQENGKMMKIEVIVYMPQAEEGIALAVHIKNIEGIGIIHMSAFDNEKIICRESGLNKVTFVIPNTHLYFGKYSIDIHLAQIKGLIKYDNVINVCPFEVVLYGKTHNYKWENKICTYLEDFYYESN